MQEILQSGVTAILVSHVMPQVRELCNKILWLDHGKQILFSDDVQTVCDAYEEFLAEKNKKPPRTKEAVLEMAAKWEQKEREKAQKKLKEKAIGKEY